MSKEINVSNFMIIKITINFPFWGCSIAIAGTYIGILASLLTTMNSPVTDNVERLKTDFAKT